MTSNTRDLSYFGNRELAMAADLLYAASENKLESSDDELGAGTALEFNPNSGEVFLVDDEYNVVMLNEKGLLERWIFCTDCAAEGFRSELLLSSTGQCAKCHKI